MILPIVGAGVAGALGLASALPVSGAAWKPLRFPRIDRATQYEVVEADGHEAWKAVANCSASAMILALDEVDLRETPILRWRWKIERGLHHSGEREKDGDDFAARVYVTFAFDAERASFWERARHRLGRALYGDALPGRAINYVWASTAVAGSRWTSPYTESTGLVSKGHGPQSDWVGVQADVLEDHRAFFEAAPTRVVGVAVMTDTDNTCAKASAYYADFVFTKQSTARGTSTGGAGLRSRGRPRTVEAIRRRGGGFTGMVR